MESFNYSKCPIKKRPIIFSDRNDELEKIKEDQVQFDADEGPMDLSKTSTALQRSNLNTKIDRLSTVAFNPANETVEVVAERIFNETRQLTNFFSENLVKKAIAIHLSNFGHNSNDELRAEQTASENERMEPNQAMTEQFLGITRSNWSPITPHDVENQSELTTFPGYNSDVCDDGPWNLNKNSMHSIVEYEDFFKSPGTSQFLVSTADGDNDMVSYSQQWQEQMQVERESLEEKKRRENEPEDLSCKRNVKEQCVSTHRILGENINIHNKAHGLLNMSIVSNNNNIVNNNMTSLQNDANLNKNSYDIKDFSLNHVKAHKKENNGNDLKIKKRSNYEIFNEIYQCQECKTFYSSYAGLLKHHISQPHTSTQFNIIHSSLDNKDSADDNVEFHTDQRSVAALIQASSVASSQYMQRPVAATRYHCEYCTKTYSTRSGLTKHVQSFCSAASGKQVEKIFNCKYCDKSYASRGGLGIHMRTHTLPFKCHICGKAFSRPWLLHGHIRTHTGEKPFTCQHCNRGFADRSNLRAHKQTHAEVKKHCCTICTKSFSRLSLLTKHWQSGCHQSPPLSNSFPTSSKNVSESSYEQMPIEGPLPLMSEFVKFQYIGYDENIPIQPIQQQHMIKEPETTQKAYSDPHIFKIV